MHRDFWQNSRSPFMSAGRNSTPLFPADSDTALILGIILLLTTEKTDPVLLLALIYILS